LVGRYRRLTGHKYLRNKLSHRDVSSRRFFLWRKGLSPLHAVGVINTSGSGRRGWEGVRVHIGPHWAEGVGRAPPGGVWVRVWFSSRLYYPFGKGPGQHIIRGLKNKKCENERRTNEYICIYIVYTCRKRTQVTVVRQTQLVPATTIGTARHSNLRNFQKSQNFNTTTSIHNYLSFVFSRS